MNRFVVLLRGINVGGKNILPMKELTPLLEAEGFGDIKTYIQSGNIVLRSSSSADQISECIQLAIKKAKGFLVSVLVLSPSDFEHAVAASPFEVSDGKTLHLYFLKEPPTKTNLHILEDAKATTESYELIDHVFYLHAPNGIGRSKLVTKIEKAMGVPVTGRNWNTIQKLVTLAES